MKNYTRIAQTFNSYVNCKASGSMSEWQDRHLRRLNGLVKHTMPTGSGFDDGTRIDTERSRGNRLVFITSFHHMDRHGTYGRWTYHDVIVTPDLAHGVNIRVTGTDYNDIKEYIASAFRFALTDDSPDSEWTYICNVAE